MRFRWKLNGAAEVLPQELRMELDELDADREEETEEIRLRVGVPMTVNVGGRELDAGRIPVVEEHLMAVIENATQASAHTALNQVRQGYVTMRGGHRIGICGTVALKEGEVANLRRVTSICIRVAKAMEGIGVNILPQLMQDERFQSTLILAPPGVGKTTLLRDLIRVSSYRGTRISVVDERSEIAAVWQGVPQFDLGPKTDVLDGCPKGAGMMLMLRAMNPQVIAVDEITRAEDIKAMEELSGCGVAIMATAHGVSAKDLAVRPLYREMMESRIFRRMIRMARAECGRKTDVEVLV